MKKYRFGDPNQTSIFKKYSGVMYFFVAWNLLGFVVWKAMSSNKSLTDEKWSSKTGTEKYLSLSGFGRDNETIQHIKIDGVHIQKENDLQN